MIIAKGMYKVLLIRLGLIHPPHPQLCLARLLPLHLSGLPCVTAPGTADAPLHSGTEIHHKLPRTFLRGGFVDMGFCMFMAGYVWSMSG